MKKKKLLKTTAKEVSGDTKAFSNKVSRGVVDSLDASTDLAASMSAGLVGFIVATAGDILTWTVQHPLKTVLLIMAVWGGSIVYHNVETRENKTVVNWSQVKADASASYQRIRAKLDEYGVPELKLPAYITENLPWQGDEPAPERNLAPVREASSLPKPKERVTTAQPPDQLGAFLQQKGLTPRRYTRVYTVERNAYHTAKRNNLSFQPNAKVTHVLRGCVDLQKGSRIVFLIDANGRVAGCRRVR